MSSDLPDLPLPPAGTYEITIRTFTEDGGMFKSMALIDELTLHGQDGMPVAVTARRMYREMAEKVAEYERQDTDGGTGQ